MAIENGNNNGMIMPVQPYGNGWGGYGNGWGGFGGLGGDGLLLALFLLPLIACFGGFGGFGMGGFGGMGMMGGLGMMFPWLMAQNVDNDVNAGFNNAGIAAAVAANGNAIAGVRQDICGVNQNVSNTGAAISAGVAAGFANAESAAAARQMASLERSFAAQTAIDGRLDGLAMGQQAGNSDIRAGIADLKYTVATENCADRYEAAQNTRDVIDAINNKGQAIMDKLCDLELQGVKNELAQSRRENDLLQNQLYMGSLREAEANQNVFFTQGINAAFENFYNRLKNCPVNSVPVYGSQPIFTCPGAANACPCGYAAA
ncbi:MAG: hypothetical protein IK132_12265 [Clostridia bacterium]|nr:hypothetical protein [Clostridia bacterium]